jgi:hypothetical protein
MNKYNIVLVPGLRIKRFVVLFTSSLENLLPPSEKFWSFLLDDEQACQDHPGISQISRITQLIHRFLRNKKC